MRTNVMRAALSSSAVVIAIACGPREPDRPPPQLAYPYPASGANNAPSSVPPAPTSARPPAGSVGPALGWPCARDTDLQCSFGRCINGRCGGCTQPSDCKAGSSCVSTWFGATCFPSGGIATPTPHAPSPAPVPAPAPAPQAPQAPRDAMAAARDRCVALTNMYRARVGAPPVARDSASEGCADGQAQADSRRSSAHANFGRCNEWAQNTCPDYPGANLDDVMTTCFAQMFAEGPGGGHYDNMTSRRYKQVFCGFVDLGGGRFWVNQDFR